MAFVFEQISSYQVLAYGGPTGNSGVDATIYIETPNIIVFLQFFRDGAAVPPNSKTIHGPTGKPMYYATYRYPQFANIIDLLRNEKPVHFSFNDVNMGAYVTTGTEPAGEGES